MFERSEHVSVRLLVASCDTYCDLWPAFSAALGHRWQDCPFPRHLITNEKPCPSSFVPTPTGRDVSWSANLRRALGMMDAEFVLLCVDDLLLTKPVDTEGVLSAVSWAKRNDATALQLVSLESVWGRNWRGGNVPRLVPVGATYRATTVFTLWNRERLAGLLNPAESAWEFEYRSPARLPPDAGVFQVRRSYFSFVNAVVKGSLVPEAVKLCTRERYPLASSRPVLAGRELGRLRLARLRSAGLRLVPPAHRKVVRNLALGRLGE